MRFSRFLSIVSLFSALALTGTAFPMLARAQDAAPPAAAPSSVPFVAHRAVYNLSLVSSSGNASPSDARGLIAYDFSGSACDGYVTNFRQRTELEPNEGEAHVSDVRSTTFEAGDGKSYRFRTDSIADGGADKVSEGEAQTMPNGTTEVRMMHPVRKKLSLPTAIIFPTQQVALVLAAARAGKSTLAAKVYDGSDDGTKIFDTLSVIGRPLTTPQDEKPAQVDQLSSVRRWPVVVSYFDESKDGSTPDYVLSFQLYENGISTDLKLNYGNFVLKAELTTLAFPPPAKTSCTK